MMLCLTEGVDYVGVEQVLVFNAATTLNTVRIMTRKDNLTDEDSETFDVVLSTNNTASVLTLQPDRATVTIRKDTPPRSHCGHT